MEKTTNFYEVNQNNSGGSFMVDDKVCHRLIIEATSQDEAIDIAESLGCYWGGVADGFDCECCGDRWWGANEIDLEKYKTEGYGPVTVYDFEGRDGLSAEEVWGLKYGDYEQFDKPDWFDQYSSKVYGTSLRFKDIEEYAQFMADSYGWTKPDIRIFYKDGTVKEIFTRELT